MTAPNGRRGVLVTGARGYLGGRICRAIASRDDLTPIGASRRREPPAGWGEIRFLSWDTSIGTAALVAATGRLDTVIHLAGTDQTRSAADPRAALDATAGTTVELLRAAAAAGARRFIYVSTAHVYGNPLVGRIDERRLPRPVHAYAIARRAAEDFVLAAHSRGTIEGVVVRLSNGIGAPAWLDIDQWGTVGNDLCRQAVAGDALKLASSGEQWRDFITLGDIAAAMLHLIDLPATQIGDGLFNLGGACPLRIRDVAELVADRTAALFGRRPTIERPSGPPTEAIDYRIDKILVTGFRPQGDFAGEIDATLRLCAGTGGTVSSL